MADKIRVAISLLKAIKKEQCNANSSQTESIQAAIEELERLELDTKLAKGRARDKRVLQILGKFVAGFSVVKRLVDFLSEVDDG